MLVKAVLSRRLVLSSPNTMLLPAAPGTPSQIRRFTPVIVEVVVEPVW